MISAHALEAQRDLHALKALDASSVRAVQREYARKLKTESPEVVIQFVRTLLGGGSWAEHVVAWETLASHKAAFAQMDDELVEEMARGLSDWPSIDLYGVTIVGPAWNKGHVSDAKISSWTKSDDRWRRRLALVSTVPLNAKSRGGIGDTPRTLKICKLLLDDRDDMVVKAMSWALRELAKRNPEDVRTFLAKEDARLAPRIKREVLSKLDTGLKNRRR